MSTPSVTPQPDVSSLPVSTQQAPSMPSPQVVPPAPTVPAVGPRLASTLSAIVSASTPTPAPAAQPNTPAARPAWQTNLGKVASVVSTGLAGVPDKGRPSFFGGLGEGARSEQQAQAQAQAIKFKSFDDQVRMAELHNQDLKMQNDTQAQTDAHTKADLDNRAMANSLGIDYDTIANHGSAVTDHLAAQTQANGGASVPPGTHLSGDGKTVQIPQDTQATRDGQKTMYNQLAPALGLPGLPPGASFVPPKMMNMLTNKIHGFDINGEPLKHDDLPTYISTTQTQRDAMAKNGASDSQLKTLDNILGIYKANLSALDDHASTVKQSDAQATAAGTLAAQTSPDAIAAEGKKAAATKQAQLDVENSPSNQAAQVKLAANKAAAEEQAKGSDGLVVAYHPGYDNADGTKGANVVMTKGEAQAQGLQHYKADGAKLNATVAGMNDVQNKLNQLAEVTTDKDKMSQVDPGIAARMLAHGKGLEVGAMGTHVDMSRINEGYYANDVKQANQATRDFVAATVAAHEAVTQLPRLQTFGQSSRMTQQQMEAAQNLLPHAGDGADFAAQKMTSLQGMLDPLRKQMPHMQGAEMMPSWLEKKNQRQQTPSAVGKFNPQTQTIDYGGK